MIRINAKKHILAFQVIRSVHSLMTRLMSQFPTEPTSSSVASKHEELDQLYAAVGKVISIFMSFTDPFRFRLPDQKPAKIFKFFTVNTLKDVILLS